MGIAIVYDICKHLGHKELQMLVYQKIRKVLE